MMPPVVQYRPVIGGTPARELHTRGPQQDAHLMASFDPLADAATHADFRNQVMADREELVYEAQAEEALKRQEAAERVAVRRTQELQTLEQDYKSQVSRLGKMHLDDNRWWAKKSTGDKIGTLALVFLGSIAALGGNGQNMAYEAVKKEIDDDLEAQKFDYRAGLEQAKGAQTSFAMAMDRYGQEDAANAVARAAALDFAAAKVGQLAAQWKGAESANNADVLRAQLIAEKERTIAAGFKFIPAAIGRKYQMSARGQMIPGLVPEAMAQKIAIERGVAPAERIDEERFKGGVQLAVESAKQRGKPDEGARFIAEKLQTAGVPQARALAEKALASLTKSPGGAGEAALRAVTEGNPVFSYGAKQALGDDANLRELDYHTFKNAAMKAVAGNVTASEERRLDKSLGDASDPVTRRHAVLSTLAMLDQIEKNIKAGVSKSSQDSFDSARIDASGAPAAAPSSAKAGWK